MKLLKKNLIQTINESLTSSDKSEVESIVKKEIKSALEDSKNKSRIKDIVNDELKSKDFENKMITLSKNVLVQLYKQLYNKRSFWTSGLSNDPN
jgi:hypothetical protein